MRTRRPLLVQVLARAPLAGRSKTRLIPALGARRAALLQRWMSLRALDTASRAAGGALDLWGHPDVEHRFFAEARARFGCTLRVQRGADLGATMHEAIRCGLETADAVLLIGSDCPALDRADLECAAARLCGDAECVLGPATDGGYYLVGLRRALPGLFSGIDWGTPRVLAQSRDWLRANAVRWAELRQLPDIDRASDLRQLGALWFGGASAGAGAPFRVRGRR